MLRELGAGVCSQFMQNGPIATLQQNVRHSGVDLRSGRDRQQMRLSLRTGDFDKVPVAETRRSGEIGSATAISSSRASR